MTDLSAQTFGHAAGKDVTHALPASAIDVEAPDTVVALCGTRVAPAIVEQGVDARAEKVSGTRVCGTCRRLLDDGKTAFPTHARGEKPPAATKEDSSMATATKTKSRGSKPAAKTASVPRSALSEQDEKKVVSVAKRLAKDGGLDEAAVATVARKLMKRARGLRSSAPPIPAALKREDVPTIEQALGIAAKDAAAKSS